MEGDLITYHKYLTCLKTEREKNSLGQEDLDKNFMNLGKGNFRLNEKMSCQQELAQENRLFCLSYNFFLCVGI